MDKYKIYRLIKNIAFQPGSAKKKDSSKETSKQAYSYYTWVEFQTIIFITHMYIDIQ